MTILTDQITPRIIIRSQSHHTPPSTPSPTSQATTSAKLIPMLIHTLYLDRPSPASTRMMPTPSLATASAGDASTAAPLIPPRGGDPISVQAKSYVTSVVCSNGLILGPGPNNSLTNVALSQGPLSAGPELHHRINYLPFRRRTTATPIPPLLPSRTTMRGGSIK
jgi:hypothetical protein